MKIVHPFVIEDFKAFLADGFSPVEICKAMKISRATYFRYLKRLKDSEIPKEEKPRASNTNFKRYYNAVMQGNFNDKDKLAELLGVSRRTLTNLENGHYLARTAQLLKVRGWSLDRIKTHLGIKSKKRLEELLGGIESIGEIKEKLEAIRTLLGEYSDVGMSFTSHWARLTVSINSLDELQQSIR